MKLFLVRRPVRIDYDEYDSIVVAAEDERQARFTHPDGESHWDEDLGWWYDGEHEASRNTWPCSPHDLTVEEIGTAAKGRGPSVVLASFNAG